MYFQQLQHKTPHATYLFFITTLPSYST